VIGDLEDLEEEDLEQLAHAHTLGIAAVAYSYFNDCIAALRVRCDDANSVSVCFLFR
jgi:hypothetical protein